jgi:MerC mercury resistance protein
MKKSTTRVLSGDRKGMLIAALCFVHCIAGPLLLSVAGFSSLIGASEKVEPVFLLSSITFGTATLVPDYRKRHHRLSCLALFSCGISCLAVRRYVRWASVAEVIVVGLGAALIIGAHALNLKFSKHCQCCEPSPSPSREDGSTTISA